MDTGLFAEVVLDARVPKSTGAFYYFVPPELENVLKRGDRVVVPFGHRVVEGYVLRLTSELLPGIKLKPILQVSSNGLPSSLVDLVDWMANTYLCSASAVLECVLPAPVRGIENATVELTDAGREAFKAGYFEAKELAGELAIVKILASRRSCNYSELKDLFGPSAYRLVRSLSKREFVKVHRSVGVRTRPKTNVLVKLCIGEEALNSVLDSLKRAPKQALILETLKSHGPLKLTDLLSMTGSTRGVLACLEAKGLISLEKIVEERDPVAARDELAAMVKPVDESFLTQEQQQSISAITRSLAAGVAKSFLLFGVTDSGKTEVYLRSAAACLETGRRALILVPEIALTPQMVAQFSSRFRGKIALLHGSLARGERYDQWHKISRGEVDVVIGARSAVFAPLPQLGLIVIDEQHEGSYKQEDGIKYDSRTVASERAKAENAVLVMGSATPSVEAFYEAMLGTHELLKLTSRVGSCSLPEIRLVDMRAKKSSFRGWVFSRVLYQELRDCLQRKQQAMLLINRRGFAPVVLCRECGYVMRCPYCDVSLSFHAAEKRLRCHYCNYQRAVPSSCRKCRGGRITFYGVGTELVEMQVKRLFPSARVFRMDSDTMRWKGSFENVWKCFARGEADILVGTQMVAKGLDLPGVALVGVVSGDVTLNLPDFRAAERTFQLITQAAGRAGRRGTAGKAIIQTFNPEHYCYQAALSQDYELFYKLELECRRQTGFPPFSRLVLIGISSKEEGKVVETANLLSRELSDAARSAGIEVLGPAPAPISKIRGSYRWRILLRGNNIDSLIHLARLAAEKRQGMAKSGVWLNIDVDPINMM